MGGVWEVREGCGGVRGVWGCERGGSEEERMDEILLVIGKKRGEEGRVRERVKKLGKKWGVWRICNIFAVTLLYPGGRRE